MRRCWALTALLVILLSGCVQVGSAGSVPECAPEEGGVESGVVLMAQSVPTASQVPCVISMPIGWTFGTLEARNGSATFWLDSDRAGIRAVEVELAPDCDVREATEVPSDHEGTRRYERVLRVDDGYAGDRFYVFTGGCAIYHFNLFGSSRAEPLASVSLALGFIDRDVLREQVHDESDGRVELDPTQDGGG